MTAAYRQRVAAFNVARAFEIDDVIDPAQTRHMIAAALGPRRRAPGRLPRTGRWAPGEPRPRR